MMSLVLRPALRLEVRLELSLHAPTPPNAIRGLSGMKLADRMLKERGAAGLMIGGLAKEMWSGQTDRRAFAKHKDIDVVILSGHCQHHPRQWEGGVDWWMFHRRHELATNGCVPLICQLRSLAPTWFSSGLYLPPRQLMVKWLQRERQLFPGERGLWGQPFLWNMNFGRFPVFPRWALEWAWPRIITDHRTAELCRPQ